MLGFVFVSATFITSCVIDGNFDTIIVQDMSIENYYIPENESFYWQYYTILRGDSISLIALKFNVSCESIVSTNDDLGSYLIEDQIIKIPIYFIPGVRTDFCRCNGS